MALGNGNPKEGDKGSNFFWELKVLQGLEAIAVAIEAGGGGGGGGGITTLTGDVTAGPGSGSVVATIGALRVTTAKIANNAVTFAKMQQIPDYTFLGNSTLPVVGNGPVTALSLRRIPYFSADITGTPDNTTFLRGDGSWQSVPPGGITTLNTSGLISGGPISAPSGTITTSMATGKLVGRFSASAGVMEEISIGTGITLDTLTGTISASGSTALNQIIGTTVDGAGGVITVGIKGYIRLPFACTITGWTVITNTIGTQSVTFDVWRSNTGVPISSAQSLVNTGVKPFILNSATQIQNSANVTSWTTSLLAGDYIAFRVDAATVASWAVLQINVTRV